MEDETKLMLRLSTRPNLAFVHCRHCHRPHLASQHEIFCPQQTTFQVKTNTTDTVAAPPLASMFFPSLRVSSFSSLIDRPPTPYRYDTDEETLEVLEDEERHWITVTPLTPPNQRENNTTLFSSEVPLTTKATSSYRKWLVSFRPWT